MALSDLYALAGDATFKSKIRMAMISAALAIIGEAPTGKNRQDEKRAALAKSVLIDGGATMLDAFAFAAASMGTLSSQSPDGDIQFIINSIWSDMAGVTGAEL